MSQIAQLKRQIEEECQAMKQAMCGFRQTASHDIIHHQYNSIGALQEQLEQVVGKKEAADIMVRTYMKVMG